MFWYRMKEQNIAHSMCSNVVKGWYHTHLLKLLNPHSILLPGSQHVLHQLSVLCLLLLHLLGSLLVGTFRLQAFRDLLKVSRQDVCLASTAV